MMMNSTTSTATYSSLSRSSSRNRPSNSRTQAVRTQPQARPAIDTSVPTTYSRTRQQTNLNATPSSYSAPISFFDPQNRQVSSTSAASSSSSHTNNSLFSNSHETFATTTSTGSFTAFAGKEEHSDTMRIHQAYDGNLTGPCRKGGSAEYMRSISPTGSLDSISDQMHSHVLALHDFTPIAPNATCLSFRAGQIIQVLNRDTSGWWDGELEGRRGWFPSNYVSGLDQVGRLKDEVLVELHHHNRHESTPSLASWTSGLSHPSSISQLGQAPIQTPMMPTFDAQNSDSLLSEPEPNPLSSENDISRSSSPTLGRKLSLGPQSRLRALSKAQDYLQDETGRFGAPSPTLSIYRAIADGDVTARIFSPTPSLSVTHHDQHPPLLTPLLHALSLLQRAVAARRQAHYQPSTACVISCVRSLLTSTECLHRDAPALRRIPQLAQERKIILSNLGTLVSQARRCSDWPGIEPDAEGLWEGTAVGEAEIEQQDWELDQMLRMGGEVLRNVSQFLEVCEANGIELPVPRRGFAHGQGSGSSGSEREMEKKMRVDLGVTTPTPAPSPHRRAQSGSNTILRNGSGPGIPRDAASRDVSTPIRPLDKSTSALAMRTKSLNDLRERRRVEQAERARQMEPGRVPMPMAQGASEQGSTRPTLRSVAHRQIHRPQQLSISSISSLSSGSIDSYGSPVTPAFPSGPCSTVQVLSALRTTHDDLLSTIAAFIGNVHSYGRDAHASSKGHLIELARETVDMVRQLLTLVEAVARHPDVGGAKVEALQSAKDALFSATNELVEAVREMTGPTALTVSEDEERHKTLNGATGVLKVAADCVTAVKICLSRPIGENPFIICLPSLGPNDSSTTPLSNSTKLAAKRQRPVSYLRRRSMSVNSIHGQEQMVHSHAIGVVSEDGEAHVDEDATIQPATIAVTVESMVLNDTSSGGSAGSESTPMEESDDEAPGSSPSEPSNEEESLLPRERKEDQKTLEAKILHGALPVPPSDATVPSTPVSPSPSLPPLDVDSVYANVLSHDYDVRDIAYNPEGAIVGATLGVMVEKMTPHDVLVDPAFHQIFMMTWRLFVSPPDFVNALTERYNLRPPPVLKEEDMEIWNKRKATPVKLRVSNLVKTWLENYWRSETDDAVLTQLSQFVRDTISLQFPAPAQRILELIRARTLSDESIVSPRPIDRTKSVDRLREGPSVPPTPVSPSEIPRPTINKALFASLKSKNFGAIAVTDFDALELARQFTIMESKLYLLVQPDEVLELGQTGGAPAINVKAISTLSTAITGWVTESILDESDAKRRTNLVKFFIKVADRCSGLNNYSTSRSILAALDSSTISRLQQTWVALPQKSKVQLEALRKLADHARNYAEYRSRLRNTTPPAVPFLGLYLTDVTFCREGNPSHRTSPRDTQRKLINFNKYHKLARIVQDMQRFQVPYNLKEIAEVQLYLMTQFENAKNAGDLQDLYRRSLLVEPRRAADAPIPSNGDGKPMLQIFGLGTLTRNQNTVTSLPKAVTPP